MAQNNFAECLKKVLVHEGGWSNHPSDPGGATMKGVIQTVYNKYRQDKGLPAQTVRNISDDELKEIYKERYWDLIRGDELPLGLDYCVFDGAVNSGPSQSIKWLQRALGVTADGKFGPVTLSALENKDIASVIKDYFSKRLAMLMSLKTWPVFGKGWGRRVSEVQKHSIEMLSEQPPVVEETVEPIETAPKADERFNVFLFRGLWGSIWSAGLDVLSEELRKNPRIDYVIVLPYTATDKAKKLLSQFQDKTILIGHSFGVGAMLQIAEEMPNEKFPLAVSFDPSQYWGRGHKISSNIDKCINFWQDAPLWFIGNQKISGAHNIHVDTTHTDIEDRRDLHKIVLDEITKL